MNRCLVERKRKIYSFFLSSPLCVYLSIFPDPPHLTKEEDATKTSKATHPLERTSVTELKSFSTEDLRTNIIPSSS